MLGDYRVGSMQIHVHHHYVTDPAIARELARLNANLEKFMSDVDDFVTLMTGRIAAQKTQIEGVAALLSSIKHQLADALQGEKLSPAAQAKLAAIMPALETNTAEITDAINANTDAAPPVSEPVPAVPDDPAPVSIGMSPDGRSS